MLGSVHPEMIHFWMERLALSFQQLALLKYINELAES